MPNDLTALPPTESSVAPVTIYGPDNRPARLSETQRTERLLGSYDSYLADTFRLPPFNPDHLIASRGYRILEEQLNLTPVRAPLNILRTSALAKGWAVEAGVGDQADPNHTKAAELAQALTYCLQHIEDAAGNSTDFRHTLYEMMGAIHYGFSVTEIGWRRLESGPYAGKLGFEYFSPKPCKQIGFGLDLRTAAVTDITSYTPLTGYQFGLPVEKVLRYTFQPENGLPYGRGIGRVVYKHTWSIDFLLKYWNVALEVFGTPFILGHAAPNSIVLARAALAQIRQGAPAVLPAGVEAELVQVAAGGLSAFNEALQYHGAQCALAYLGSTLTTGTSSGGTNTNALGQVHQDTQDYSLGFVRTDVENVINFQLIRRWVEYNFGAECLEIAPLLSLGQWDSVDMANLAKAFEKLTNSNVLFEGEPSIREHLNLPPASPEHQQILDTRRARKTQPPDNSSADAGQPSDTEQPPAGGDQGDPDANRDQE